MNLTRGWLSPGKPRCLAPAWLCAVFFALGVYPCLGIDEDPSSRSAQAAEADVLPGGDQPATADLALTGTAAAKADALAAFSQAIIADDSADTDAALADYQKTLSLDPGYTELAVKVAVELARRGDPSSGIQVLKDSIKASPKAPLAYLYLSQLYAKYLEKPGIGLKYAQQALDLDPNNFTSYVAVYEIYEALNQPRKAADVLASAGKSRSTDPQFWLLFGDTLLRSLGDGPAAGEQLAGIASAYGKALALDGNTPATLTHVADFYARTDREKEAIPLYLKALKLSPPNPPDDDDTQAAIRNSLAVCYAAVGRTPEAISALKQLIKDYPLRYESYDTLCGLYEHTGDLEAALAICKQMMLLNETDHTNYVREALLLMREKKLDAAIQTLTDARSKFPAEAEVSYALGLALSEAKRYQESVGIFEQAADEAAGGETEMLGAQFYFDFGAAEEESGHMDKAVDLFKKSIALDPKNSAEAYNYLGFMWVDRGLNLDEAGGYIKKALEMDPENPAYIDSLGWYYFKKGEFAQAVETLRKAATLIQPEDAIVDEHLGDAYSATNDTTNALKYWEKASGIDKDNKEILVKIAGARQKLARQGAPAHTTP